MAINKELIQDVIKFIFSRPSLRLKIQYLFLSIVFIPIILIERRNEKGKGSKPVEESLVGDDIYPLF